MNVAPLNDRLPPDHALQIEALVLNCMDYRMVGPVADYLNARGLHGRYDQIVLAGGSIGVMSGQTTAWSETFWQHVRLARKLHGVSKIIVIDHRDCVACKPLDRLDGVDDWEHETVIHMIWMEALADEIKTREPDLDVELLLMDLDETIDVFAP